MVRTLMELCNLLKHWDSNDGAKRYPIAIVGFVLRAGTGNVHDEARDGNLGEDGSYPAPIPLSQIVAPSSSRPHARSG